VEAVAGWQGSQGGPAMAHGPWPTWAMAHGHAPWTMAHGPWPMAHGPWAMAMGHGHMWRMAHGPWAWSMGHGPKGRAPW